MKKITFLFLMVVAMALSPLLTMAVNTVTHTITYSNNLTVGTDTLGGVTYSTVTYGGLRNFGMAGMPSLPVDYISFSVPYNATNFTVTTTVTRWVNYNLDYLLYPCQQPRLMNDTTPLVITLPDSAAYFSGVTYPGHQAWVEDEGFVAGENHVVTVAVQPCTYTHTSNSNIVRKPRSLTVRVNYELSDSLNMYPIVREDSALRQEGYELAKSIVVNPSAVVSNVPTSTLIDTTGLIINPIINGGGATTQGDSGGGWTFDPPENDSTYVNPNPGAIYDGEYPYLIVTTPELVKSVRRIAALKKQMGYNVAVVTMNQVMSDEYAQQGDFFRKADGTIQVAYNDSAGVLRQFLKKYYVSHGIKYVLFVGDIPYRIVNSHDLFDYHGNSYDPDALTDVYFADLNADWSNIYVDRLAELFVGRIPAKAVDNVDNYTDKLFRYELNPGNGDYSYLQKAFFSKGREFMDFQDKFKSLLTQVFPNQIIINDSTTNNSNHPNGKDIIDALNANPVGFINIFNHGGRHDIMVYGSNYGFSGNRHYISHLENKDTITGNGLDCLRNKYKPMIFYSTSCHTIPFDITNTITFGESFITGKDYGGPVYIGYTRPVVSYQADSVSLDFAKMINEGYYKLGEALTIAKMKGYPCLEIFLQALLGDPELELWTNIPQEYNTVQVTRTDSVVTISGIDILPSRVSYMTKNNLMTSKLVNSPTVRLTNASPNSTIMLYKHDCIPYIAPLLLQNTNINTSQYVIAKDVSAGYSVDNIRLPGDVTVKNGTQFEIEAQGSVTLHGGFKVEKGATFAVHPSSF